MGGVQVERGGVGTWGVGVSVQSMGRWGKTSVQTFSNPFLKKLTEEAVTTEAGSLFQYFTTFIENANPLLRTQATVGKAFLTLRHSLLDSTSYNALPGWRSEKVSNEC